MFRVECVVYERFRDELVGRLHSSGLVQVEGVSEEFAGEAWMSRSGLEEGVRRVSGLVSQSKEVLALLSPHETSGESFVESALDVDTLPRVEVGVLGEKELFTSSSRFLEDCVREVKSHDGRLVSLRSREGELASELERYGLLSGLETPLEYFGRSGRLYALVGDLLSENVPLILEGLEREFSGAYLASDFGVRDGRARMVLCIPSDASKALDQIMSSSRFRLIPVEGSGTVAQHLKSLTLEMDSTGKSIAEEELAMKKLYEKYYRQVLVILELLLLQKQRYDINMKFASTKNTVLLRMWVPAKRFSELESIIRGVCGSLCIISVDKDPKDAPVLLDNPGFFKPFEMFTRMFSMPVYNQIDPTMLVAPTFMLFFGLMFADAFYGILLFLIAYAIGRKYAAYSASVRDLSSILRCLGLSSVVFGIVSGSYLGDFMGKYVLGSPKGSQAVALWLDPLYNGNMMAYMVLVFSIGFVHVTLGYFSGAFDAVRRRDYKKAFTDYATMVLAPLGLLLYAVKGWYFGIAISAVSLLIIFLKFGLMGFYLRVSGLLGNVVSYARLLALMASSGGIAMTVNFMTAISFSIPYVGIIVAPLVFIGGHTINLALNVLGSFVHSLRLHYVEFFGTFYEGGGVEFKPFMEERTYSKLIQKEVN